MTVDTKSAQGRRQVHYESLDDLLQDAQSLAAGEVEMRGNWSLGQILKHLAGALETSIDGNPFMLPAPLRWVGGTFLKRKFLTTPLSPGFKVPRRAAALKPDPTSTEDGLAALKHAIERLKHEQHREQHPMLGRLSIDEWNQFHLRHAEMHMSFAVPAGE